MHYEKKKKKVELPVKITQVTNKCKYVFKGHLKKKAI